MFKYELHMHAKPCSKCGGAPICDMVDGLVERGYAGAVLTDHFFHGNTGIDRGLPWEDFAGAYVAEWQEGAAYAKTRGIQLFFGIEEGYGAGKEALIYGLSPEVLVATPAFNEMNIHEKADFIHANGGLIFYAHPFRARAYIPDPDAIPDVSFVDGIEVYNAFNEPERNAIAENFAKERTLRCISGGDAHKPDHLGRAGIAFERNPDGYADFLTMLKNGNYKLIVDGEPSDLYENGYIKQ